ncbi:hypothetical protein SAE01_11770 [Segetibacter aerophilus]|uniref:Uncharacterized protein n=1 Tax=Segetibacter aerophilus TaxID=670293 RepID=A0A512B9P9_9BACT|nr:hypothetical protein SAE01_11770 [Segetibacter aerophilus]
MRFEAFVVIFFGFSKTMRYHLFQLCDARSSYYKNNSAGKNCRGGITTFLGINAAK